MLRYVLSVTALAALLLWTASVLADTVTLRDGTVREGTIVSEDDETVTMEVRMGGLKGKIVIPRHDIAVLKTQPLPPDPVEVEAAQLRKVAEGLAGKDAADAWVALGDLYAKNTGYSAQARAAYEKAILTEPDHAKARHGLGHVKTAAGWQKTDDLRRERGLVPLGEVWVRPDERTWIIDRRHVEQTDELRIGARQSDDFSKETVQNDLALKRAEDEARQRDAQRWANGDSLLASSGYLAGNDPYYIGGPGVWADGVGVESAGYSFFAGTVGTGWYGGNGYSGNGCGPQGGHGGSGGYRGGPRPMPYGGGWGATYSSGGNSNAAFKQAHGYSPGFRSGNFSFGTSLNPYRGGGYGGCWGGGYGGGWGININGGSGSTHWNLNMGGFSGSSSYRSSTGIGFGGL